MVRWLRRALKETLWNPREIELVQAVFGPGWAPLFRALSALGDVWGVLPLLALLRWLRGSRAAYALTGVTLAGTSLAYLLKRLIGLPRPHAPGIRVEEREHTPSFPSGHVTTATGLWGGLAQAGRLPTGVAAGLIGLVGLARLALGVHYLGDLLGGALLGLTALVARRHSQLAIRRWLCRRSPRERLIGGSLVAGGALLALPFSGPSETVARSLGALAGAAVAIPLQERYVPFEPEQATQRPRELALGLGVLGLILLAAWRLRRRRLRSALLCALATLWIALLAPLLFVRLGQARGLPTKSRTS